MLLASGDVSQLSAGPTGLVTPVQAAPFASQRALQVGGGLRGVAPARGAMVKQVRPPARAMSVTAG